MASYLLVSNEIFLSFFFSCASNPFFKGNSNSGHLLFDGLSPIVIPILFINFVSLFHTMGEFDSKFMCSPPILTFDFGNNCLSLFQGFRDPPLESGLVVDLGCHHVLRSFNRVCIFPSHIGNHDAIPYAHTTLSFQPLVVIIG